MAQQPEQSATYRQIEAGGRTGEIEQYGLNHWGANCYQCFGHFETNAGDDTCVAWLAAHVCEEGEEGGERECWEEANWLPGTAGVRER